MNLARHLICQGLCVQLNSRSYLLTKTQRDWNMAVGDKPHVVCIPYPSQSHIKAMLKLAKLLHNKGCHITFVNTEYNHRRLLKARGPNSLDGLPDFRFEAIPDGLPPSDANATQHIPSLCESIRKNALAPFLSLVSKINDGCASPPDVPPVTCIVSDGFMSFTLTAGEQLGVPVILFFTMSACGVMGFYQLHVLLEKGLTPLKDVSYVTNGYLDTVIDWIPGMKDIRLKDLPSFIRTTDPNNIPFNFCMEAAMRASKASAIILHTFDALEQDLLNAFTAIFPIVYSIGPLQLFLNHISQKDKSESIGYNLWKEESECLKWLDSKAPRSVIYVNFGSITSMTKEQLEELGWGLVNSHHNFLWIIRPDLVMGDQSDSVTLPPELAAEIEERGLIVAWCPQEEVLNHQSVGGFMTHCGWNSTIESLSAGVPMICWPCFGDQQTNCRYTCTEWGVGLEIDSDVKREEVERLVREVMGGEKGKKMKSKAMEWKELAEKATGSDGSSTLSLNKLVDKLLLSMGG
ncbi:7-deoxyloganetin glucosyltransferase-like isoform X2 [Rhododendron vialii]|uniref:7-deoxyloganetin glucosyltransferase-like isoform X2 n=1 Tax=Rhododendron vialii TaxID=182163 RepID=UPI00265ECF3E|nr:7-deoxyloganetin glucosyltransferase-like isoform X2 [Rhododendron vialii]